MGVHRIGFHYRPKGGFIQMGVSRAISEKQIAYLAVGHDLENQKRLQVVSAAGQLFGKSPVLLDLIGYFHPVYVDEFTNAPPLPGSLAAGTGSGLGRRILCFQAFFNLLLLHQTPGIGLLVSAVFLAMIIHDLTSSGYYAYGCRRG